MGLMCCTKVFLLWLFLMVAQEDEFEEVEVDVKYKTIKVKDWERVNANVAVWARDKDEVTDEEYQNFYKVRGWWAPALIFGSRLERSLRVCVCACVCVDKSFVSCQTTFPVCMDTSFVSCQTSFAARWKTSQTRGDSQVTDSSCPLSR